MVKIVMLLTKELERSLPPLYSQEKVKDPIVRAKFFHPYSSWEWYPIEYDPKKRLFFGFVHGFEDELGYFSLDELMEVRAHGLPIERDRYFTPEKLSKIKEKLGGRTKEAPSRRRKPKQTVRGARKKNNIRTGKIGEIERKKINKEISAYLAKPYTYFEEPEKALDRIDRALANLGYILVDPFGHQFPYNLGPVGFEGSRKIEFAWRETGQSEYTPRRVPQMFFKDVVKNSEIIFKWYRMSSGKYEITAYAS